MACYDTRQATAGRALATSAAHCTNNSAPSWMSAFGGKSGHRQTELARQLMTQRGHQSHLFRGRAGPANRGEAANQRWGTADCGKHCQAAEANSDRTGRKERAAIWRPLKLGTSRRNRRGV